MPSLTATAEPSNAPPRVRLDVDVSDQVPIPNEITIVRAGTDGAAVRVRQAEPADLSGGLVTVYDYEPRYGETVTYSYESLPATTDTATLTPTGAWLLHPLVPDWSVQLTSTLRLAIGTHADRLTPARRGVYRAVGRPRPIVLTQGARGDEEYDLVVYADTAADVAALRTLLADETPIQLGIPPALGWQLPQRYVSIGDVTWQAFTPAATEPKIVATLPALVVDRPEGPLVGQWTWADVASTYATWADVAAAYSTWADLAIDNRLP